MRPHRLRMNPAARPLQQPQHLLSELPLDMHDVEKRLTKILKMAERTSATSVIFWKFCTALMFVFYSKCNYFGWLLEHKKEDAGPNTPASTLRKNLLRWLKSTTLRLGNGQNVLADMLVKAETAPEVRAEVMIGMLCETALLCTQGSAVRVVGEAFLVKLGRGQPRTLPVSMSAVVAATCSSFHDDDGGDEGCDNGDVDVDDDEAGGLALQISPQLPSSASGAAALTVSSAATVKPAVAEVSEAVDRAVTDAGGRERSVSDSGVDEGGDDSGGDDREPLQRPPLPASSGKSGTNQDEVMLVTESLGPSSKHVSPAPSNLPRKPTSTKGAPSAPSPPPETARKVPCEDGVGLEVGGGQNVRPQSSTDGRETGSKAPAWEQRGSVDIGGQDTMASDTSQGGPKKRAAIITMAVLIKKLVLAYKSGLAKMRALEEKHEEHLRFVSEKNLAMHAEAINKTGRLEAEIRHLRRAFAHEVKGRAEDREKQEARMAAVEKRLARMDGWRSITQSTITPPTFHHTHEPYMGDVGAMQNLKSVSAAVTADIPATMPTDSVGESSENAGEIRVTDVAQCAAAPTATVVESAAAVSPPMGLKDMDSDADGEGKGSRSIAWKDTTVLTASVGQGAVADEVDSPASEKANVDGKGKADEAEKVTLSNAQIDDLRVALVVAHYEAKNKTVVECSGNGSSERRTEKAAEVRSSTSTTSARGSLGIIRGAHDEGKRGQEPRNARERPRGQGERTVSFAALPRRDSAHFSSREETAVGDGLFAEVGTKTPSDDVASEQKSKEQREEEKTAAASLAEPKIYRTRVSVHLHGGDEKNTKKNSPDGGETLHGLPRRHNIEHADASLVEDFEAAAPQHMEMLEIACSQVHECAEHVGQTPSTSQSLSPMIAAELEDRVGDEKETSGKPTATTAPASDMKFTDGEERNGMPPQGHPLDDIQLHSRPPATVQPPRVPLALPPQTPPPQLEEFEGKKKEQDEEHVDERPTRLGRIVITEVDSIDEEGDDVGDDEAGGGVDDEVAEGLFGRGSAGACVARRFPSPTPPPLIGGQEGGSIGAAAVGPSPVMPEEKSPEQWTEEADDFPRVPCPQEPPPSRLPPRTPVPRTAKQECGMIAQGTSGNTAESGRRMSEEERQGESNAGDTQTPPPYLVGLEREGIKDDDGGSHECDRIELAAADGGIAVVRGSHDLEVAARDVRAEFKEISMALKCARPSRAGLDSCRVLLHHHADVFFRDEDRIAGVMALALAALEEARRQWKRGFEGIDAAAWTAREVVEAVASAASALRCVANLFSRVVGLDGDQLAEDDSDFVVLVDAMFWCLTLSSTGGEDGVDGGGRECSALGYGMLLAQEAQRALGSTVMHGPPRVLIVAMFPRMCTENGEIARFASKYTDQCLASMGIGAEPGAGVAPLPDVGTAEGEETVLLLVSLLFGSTCGATADGRNAALRSMERLNAAMGDEAFDAVVESCLARPECAGIRAELDATPGQTNEGDEGTRGSGEIDGGVAVSEEEAEQGQMSLDAGPLSLSQFSVEAFLGRGKFGNVMAVRKTTGATPGHWFALKGIPKHAAVEGEAVPKVINEKEILEVLDHPFVLKLFGTFQDLDRVYFVTELLDGGDLFSLIRDRDPGVPLGLPPEAVLLYGAMLVEALGHVHSHGIAYRDLKSKNVMIDMDGYVRIVDMSLAKRPLHTLAVDGERQDRTLSHSAVGTPEYMAPELVCNDWGHSRAVDLWALGVLFFEMVEGRTPFLPRGTPLDGPDEKDTQRWKERISCNVLSVKRRGVPFPKGFADKAGAGVVAGGRDGGRGRPSGAACEDLIRRVMMFDDRSRLGFLGGGMDDVKEHAYFDGISWDDLRGKRLPTPWVPEELIPPPTRTAADVKRYNHSYKGDQV